MSEVTDEIIVLTTVANREQAREFGRGAVEQHLAACVNCLGEVFSFFRWESDNVGEEAEVLLLIKTHRRKLADLEHYFDAAHPYEIPEFLVLQPDGIGTPYRAWLHRELKLDRA